MIANFDVKIRPIISSFFLILKTKEHFLCRQDRFIEAQETKEKAQKQFMEDNKYIENKKKNILWKKIEKFIGMERLQIQKVILLHLYKFMLILKILSKIIMHSILIFIIFYF